MSQGSLNDEPMQPVREWFKPREIKATVRKFEAHQDPETDTPYEVIESPGNLILDGGYERLLDLLIGVAVNPFDNTNSRIGVGDSTTAADRAQTGLQASTNVYYMTMDASYPARTSTTVEWQATFDTDVANYAWNEWCIDNGTVANVTAVAPTLNRKVTSFGTKSGQTWVLNVSITG